MEHTELCAGAKAGSSDGLQHSVALKERLGSIMKSSDYTVAPERHCKDHDVLNTEAGSRHADHKLLLCTTGRRAGSPAAA